MNDAYIDYPDLAALARLGVAEAAGVLDEVNELRAALNAYSVARIRLGGD